MAGFDPSNLMRGIWASLASIPSQIIPSKSGAGSSSHSTWQQWLAKEQEKLGLGDSYSGRCRSSESYLGDLTSSGVGGFSPLQTCSGSWLDNVLALITWSAGRQASQQRGRLPERSREASPDTAAGKRASSNKVTEGQELVPCQFDPSLTAREAYAACGPAAAVAFARVAGKDASLRKVLDLAKTVGWTPEGGMNGVANQKRLLDKLGIQTKLDTSADWNTITRLASNGTPVTISTPGHYFVADSYDPQTGRFHVGASGVAYRGGKEWMTRQEMERLAGGLNGALTISQSREWSV